MNVCFTKEAVTITGELQKYSCVADSGNRMHRRFCPKCGTPMFSEGEQRSDLIFIRVGTLDDPEVVKPEATVWTAEAPAWACFDSSLPQFDGARPPVA